jgi:ABC-type bacteriocin/lantibiotic exporter with double-glycine peptidase domain
LNRFISKIFNILTPREKARLFILAGFDLLMGIADIVFLVAILLAIRLYTGNGAILSLAPRYHTLIAGSPVLVTGVLLLLFCIKNIIGVLISKSQHRFVFGISSRLSDKNITDYQKASYTDFVNIDSSQRIRLISQVPIEFSTYILTNLQQIIAQGILIVFTIAGILWYHPALFVMLLILLIPPVFLLGWFAKQQLKKMRVQIKTNSAKVIQYLQEALSGYVESNIYGRQGFFAGRYNQYQQQMNSNIATLQTLQGLSSRFFEVFALLGFFILIVLNKYYGGKSTIDVLTIGVFMAAAYKIIPGMVKILNSAGQMKTYSFLLDDLADNLSEKQATIKTTAYQQIQHISFDDVCFRYKEHKILDGVSLTIEPGDMIGISGTSGRGKTTMINLLLGFLQQDKGTIRFNNEVANANDRKQYWPQIAYVKQQGFFINDTILKNITLNDGYYDVEQLNQALQISGLDAILKNDPDGINKQILEHGKNISGGQRQRVALARALYRDFNLLILDEPFSELDHTAEQELLSRLKNLGSDKMILLITHNRASLSFCNKIISTYEIQI